MVRGRERGKGDQKDVLCIKNGGFGVGRTCDPGVRTALVTVQVLHLAGINAQQVVLLLEDHQFVHPAFLEMINSLLSSGKCTISLPRKEK